mmetsp:Transcript_16865/g.31936  ORF Transcript_16865/g.31936 Transcript_16865/m.31936 type:complete len:840 (-) Transcript_16865:30-2549(-)
MSLKFIGESKQAASPFFAPKPPRSHLLTTPGGHISRVKDVDDTPKSSVPGAAFNLINAIVGAGIVGMPFAINQCSLILGVFMIIFFAILTIKSLRLLIETAKHVDVSTYERLAEASFGRLGFNFISIAMFIMAYGAMVGYMIIIKTNLSFLLGVEEGNVYMERAVLTVSTLAIIMPLSLQRDMSNLSKTSAISVIFDIILVVIVATFSPVTQSIKDAGGIMVILKDASPDITTFFTGIGVLCFAFVCQHSAFIIAASLDKPTRARWNMVTGIALVTCCILATAMGVTGYLGFMHNTDGDILVNLGRTAETSGIIFQRASNAARGLLCTTMFFVYPMELFVARHVCVVLFFKGRRAHEGDDHSVLARKDRRAAVTAFLYVISLVPALIFDDLGSVFSVTGSLGGAALSYIGPGITYLAVHGSEFLDLASQRWPYVPTKLYLDSNMSVKTASTSISTGSHTRKFLNVEDIEEGGKTEVPKLKEKNMFVRSIDCILWYILFMPLWCRVALIGKSMMKKHREEEALKSPMPYSLGKIVHHTKPHFGTLMRPMHMRRNHPESGIDNDSVERKPLIRTLSNPQINDTFNGINDLAFTSASIKLPPLTPVKKATVGFALDPNQSALHERVPFDRSNPISKNSFPAASFEVVRESDFSSYGATGISNTSLEDVRQIKSTSSGSLSEVEEDSSANRSSIADSQLEDGLTFGDENDNESEESSIFVGDEDKQQSSSSDHSEQSSINVQSSLKKLEELSFPSMTQTREIPALKLVDKIPNLDSIKVNPAVKKRLNERGNVASIQAIEGKDEEVEDDPQDDMPSIIDFGIAIFFIIFGIIATAAGLSSSLL